MTRGLPIFLAASALAFACGGGRGRGGGASGGGASRPPGAPAGSCLVCDYDYEADGSPRLNTRTCGEAGGEPTAEGAVDACSWLSGWVECGRSEGCAGLGWGCRVCSPAARYRLAECGERPGIPHLAGSRGGPAECSVISEGDAPDPFGLLRCVGLADACDGEPACTWPREDGREREACDDGSGWPPVAWPDPADPDRRLVCVPSGRRCE